MQQFIFEWILISENKQKVTLKRYVLFLELGEKSHTLNSAEKEKVGTQTNTKRTNLVNYYTKQSN
jgi:hypothetical protein